MMNYTEIRKIVSFMINRQYVLWLRFTSTKIQRLIFSFLKVNVFYFKKSIDKMGKKMYNKNIKNKEKRGTHNE